MIAGFKSRTQREETHRIEEDREPLSSFIIRTVSIFLQVQTTCRWYSTPANYRAGFQRLAHLFLHLPLLPSSLPRQTMRRPRQPWCCALLIYLSRNVIISFYFLATFTRRSDSALFLFFCASKALWKRKVPNFEQTNVLCSGFLHCNSITRHKQFIVSKLFLYPRVVWHWNEKCGLCTKLNSRFHSAPLTMCVSQHLGPRWIARPVIEVVFLLKPFCQVKHS